ncbi:MAG: sigma-70 family RNA polymerase sigma factor [Clostridia bacterium]|nr:sigma-70 family RNA polymerase sigma factor [Clostridia bacterium]
MKALSKQIKEVNSMDDLHIIELYFARDEQAIKETDMKYGKLCYRIAYNILHCKEDAEECVNDTYIGAWNAIPPTKPNHLTAFLCRITRNLSFKRLEAVTRQKRAHAITVSLDELAEVLPDESIRNDVSDEAIGRLISEFLRGEKEDVRNVFLRKYWFCDSIGEIAERYSFTESKVKNMLYHTRNKLKKYLIKEGIEI